MFSTASKINRYNPCVLIDGNGNFNENIRRDLNLADENIRLGTISIMGVQSTGKSTLLNKCFSTGFDEMDASRGMKQTTKGIWIAKCPSQIGDHKVLILDTEGSDGSERGREGNETFERKIALFALAMSETLIFNMKYENVNLYQGASWPLLQTVLEVMVRKFSTPRKMNLVFVLRDQIPGSPLNIARAQLIQGLREIWEGIRNPQAQGTAPLEAYFNVEVIALPHFIYARDQFEKEVADLRDWLFKMIHNGRLNPASSYVDLAEWNWDDIKDDKILNLQMNRKMVDQILCHRAAEEKCHSFINDEVWVQIKKYVESGAIVPSFGKVVSSIIDNYSTMYDKETLYLDQNYRDKSRKHCIDMMSQDVGRIHLLLVELMRSATLKSLQQDIVNKIRACENLEGFDPIPFFLAFIDLVNDAEIQEVKWYHTEEKSERLKLELRAFQEGGSAINAILKLQKKHKKLFRRVAQGSTSALSIPTVIANAEALSSLQNYNRDIKEACRICPSVVEILEQLAQESLHEKCEEWVSEKCEEWVFEMIMLERVCKLLNLQDVSDL